MRRVCVFDVNETLLDLSALDGPFEAAFGDAGVRREWFAQLLGSMLTSTIIGRYRDFPTLAVAALQGVAARRGVELDDGATRDLLAHVRQLPPHPDVVPALDRLAGAGFRLATLTNSTEAVVTAQLEHAGIADRFERILSADSVRRLKPAREPYEMAARELGVPVDGIRLIAAHVWDVAGAMAAGARAAFVVRPGATLDPGADSPDVSGPDLAAVAEAIIEAEAGR